MVCNGLWSNTEDVSSQEEIKNNFYVYSLLLHELTSHRRFMSWKEGGGIERNKIHRKRNRVIRHIHTPCNWKTKKRSMRQL